LIKSLIKHGNFLIIVDTQKFTHTYYLASFGFYDLDYFSAEKIDKSMLKQYLANAIRKWCNENLDKIIIID
jgi:hypothetical protein